MTPSEACLPLPATLTCLATADFHNCMLLLQCVLCVCYTRASKVYLMIHLSLLLLSLLLLQLLMMLATAMATITSIVY